MTQEWQQRVLIEKQELDEKLIRLTSFISGNSAFAALPEEDKELLRQQRTDMIAYSETLAARIQRFT